MAQALTGMRDAESAFEFIEWFARDRPTPLGDGDGCTAEEVAAVEERLGLRLPDSMAAFYRLLGWRTDLTRNQDTLIFLHSLCVVGGALVYRIENQACASWGVRLDALYERLPLPDYPDWWQPDVPRAVRWFGGPGVLLREDSRTWLWVLARDAASLARIRDALPGGWQDAITG